MALAAITPPQDSQPALSTIDPRIQEPEVPDAWEYEYSNTETDTYYVTIDLTTPNVEPRRRPKPRPADRDAKGRWKNHGITSQRREKPPSPKIYRYTAGGEDEGATPAAEAEGSQKKARGDESAHGIPENVVRLKEEDEEEEEEEEEEEMMKTDAETKRAPVQILDLHSDNPLVSYRGQVFSCEWASNIGTELLFMEHDNECQLPVLRSLPGDVDLLAASSCRLIPKSITLEPRLSARSRMATALPSRTDSRNNDSTVSIPVGQAASQKRRDQARFLERLMNIKREKGQTDMITVIAQKRQLNNKWKLIWRKRRQAERTRLTRFIRDKANASLAREEVEKAKQRLQEMDTEDGMTKNRISMVGDGNESMAKRSGRKKKTASGGSASQTGTVASVALNPGIVTDTPTPTVSTPGWANTEGEDEVDGDMEEQEYIEGQEMEYREEDEGLYDEDNQGGVPYD